MADFFRKVEENWKRIQNKDKVAKEKGKLVGRYIREPLLTGMRFMKLLERVRN